METLLDLDALETLESAQGQGASKVVSIADRDLRLQQVVRRLRLRRMACQGLNAKQAAEALGLAPATVRDIYRDPAFRAEVKAQMSEVFEEVDEDLKEQTMTLHDKIEKLAWTSFSKLEYLLTEENTDLTDYQRAKLCEGMLDRAVEKTRINAKEVKMPTFAAEDLARASVAAREMQTSLERRLKRA